MANRTNLTPEKKEKFLELLIINPNVSFCANKLKVSRDTLYRHRREDEQFAAAWDEALETGTDALEDEAIRRAYEGVKKPVYQGGKLVGHVQEYSDTLLIFMLKARRPEKFRERTDITSGGKPLPAIAITNIEAVRPDADGES